jgi:S-adenosylmethionine:tRNA ribosyltransferase-isomerase
MTNSKISLENFDYHLPDSRIAHYPAEPRDHSKLLHCRKDGSFAHYRFYDLPDLLQKGDCLFFNDTKVIPARLHFINENGANIEVFLLEPLAPSQSVLAMQTRESCTWECLVGNLKKVRGKTLRTAVEIAGKRVVFSGDIFSSDSSLRVRFSWDNPELTFAEILDAVGNIPLPPYIKRRAEKEDKVKYQTIYGKNEGAVAAPTAGLHFTEKVFEDLEKRGIRKSFLTLHVSSGTFMPVKTDDPMRHEMHKEKIIVSKTVLEDLLQAERVIPVGTTSMRTLESLFWYADILTKKPDAPFFVPQFYPYENKTNLDLTAAVRLLLQKMDDEKITELEGETQIFILPGYNFRVCEGIVTNFHQPKSTLILLIAALIGENWRALYETALREDYRFLSYGDSSFLEKA